VDKDAKGTSTCGFLFFRRRSCLCGEGFNDGRPEVRRNAVHDVGILRGAYGFDLNRKIEGETFDTQRPVKAVGRRLAVP
jgi:hypothetical protein